MIPTHAKPRLVAAALAALLLGACAAPPPKPEEAPPARQVHRQVVAQHYEVEFEVEVRRSRIDATSCFAFITGTIRNGAGSTLSRRSGLQFVVYGRDGLLFRDLTHPRADVPPGSSVQFELVQSPLHHQQCPPYERIELALTPVLLRTQ